METKHLAYLVLILIIAGSFLLVHQILAENQKTTGAANIQYPVKELGSCANQTACKAYCDKSEHAEACLDFAEKNNLMSHNEIATAKKFIASGNKGPGGCKGKDGCETYCNDIDHMDECVAFAEKNDLIPPEKLAEAKKVQAAIKRGVKPPPCKNKTACDVYCENPDHMEECVTFGMEAGFIQGKELEDAQKMLSAIKRGVRPPPCHGKNECDKYCQNPNNMEVCMNFAIEAGFMTEEQKAESQKMLAALKKGIKPPPCRGKDDCDAYCRQEEHLEECTNFAEAAGFMTAEQATMARKTGGKGPGGCKGKDECDAFCNNPDNQETCFNFAKENGMIPEEDLKMMEEGKQKFKESLNQAPSVVLDCLNSSFGSEMMEKFKSGAAMPPKEIGDQMRQCFEKAMPLPPQGTQLQAGPGGCKAPEECKTYCESHTDECKNFVVPAMPSGPAGGQANRVQTGPGGCQTPEECENYCKTNPDACKNFQPPPTSSQPTPVGPSPINSGGPSGPGEQFVAPPGPPCNTPEQCQQMQNQMMPNQPPPDFQPPPENQPLPTESAPPPPNEPPPVNNTQNEPGSSWNLLLRILGFKK